MTRLAATLAASMLLLAGLLPAVAQTKAERDAAHAECRAARDAVGTGRAARQIAMDACLQEKLPPASRSAVVGGTPQRPAMIEECLAARDAAGAGRAARQKTLQACLDEKTAPGR